MKEAQRNELPSLGRKSPHQMAGDRFPTRTKTDRLSKFEEEVREQFRDINQTLLSLALHIEGSIEKPIEEPIVETPTPKVWSPQKSDMLIWVRDKKGISWDNHYKGSKIFLVCGGPSLNSIDLSLMDNRGVMSMAMNNSWLKVKPTFWIGFDVPGRFHYERWMDPSILKFVPWHLRDKNLYKRVEGELVKTEQSPLDAPNCWFLSNTATFNEDTWFTEKDANWGGAVKNLDPEGGFRVTMFGALRTLYYLGFQEVYLIGCDWEMLLEGNAYAWEEDKDREIKEKNNHMYSWMEQVFKKLQPGFDRAW